MKEIDLTVIIVGWKVKDSLKNCLVSIFQETSKINLEVIVVDNASCDETVEMVAEDFPKVALISNLHNRGFARAVNQGLKQARGRYVLLLNPDTIIVDQALDRMAAFMDSRPEAGIAGCRLLNGDKSLQPSVRKFPSFWGQLAMMFKLHHLIKLNSYLMTGFNYQKEGEVDQVMGAFFMINRKVMETIGLFDEQYHLWFEEVDYCFRAKKHGFKVIYTPQAQIIHLGGQSFAQTYRIKSQWNFSKSRLRYIKKNQSFWLFLIILILMPISLLLSFLFSLISPKNV
ncbi:glycosyltransferase family 2 protein [Patescibacteria group bacterium]|nr:glycosyltransferase family 2 protein [Patescibacteria group bacterium]